jgi:arginine decarboxylase
MEHWSYQKSRLTYGISSWGDGYFDVNPKGNVTVHPDRTGPGIDMYELVDSLVQRGIEAPVLLRFDGILRDRVARLNQAFRNAILEEGYAGQYRGAYPIKVNQQRHVVDIIREAGRGDTLGLEVGSKPELIAVLAIHDTPEALLLCNGYKDSEYIELALLAKKLGRRSILIIEQMYELDKVLEVASKVGIDAEIGLRMKPVTKGSGRWEASSGERAKFGLTIPEIAIAVQKLADAGCADWLKLLHYHIGSQIPSIAAIKRALREATRVYTELKQTNPSLCFLDVGGGLAVDYDGSRTNFESSMNYTVEEYARDVVSAISVSCKEEGVDVPDIVTEAGRALVAHHAVLITQVIDVTPSLDVVTNLAPPPTEHATLKQLWELYQTVSVKNCHESLNDALGLKDEILERFVQGDMTLAERAYADKTYWHLIAKIKSVSHELKYIPEDLERLDEYLRDTYFCNFSVFQSIPDSWAIGHLFPMMPIHRLNEEPKRRGTIADVSCDSDGKIDRFTDLKDVKSYLMLHAPDGKRYYLGAFIVGAYQEILGDLHNLFGDTNAVHIDLGPGGEVELTHVVEGDTVQEVLKYVQYDEQDLIQRLRTSLERGLRAGLLTPEESLRLQKRFKESLDEYTYLKV